MQVQKYFFYAVAAIVVLACNFPNDSDNSASDQVVGRSVDNVDQVLIDISGALFEVEIAQSPQSRDIGLSGRPYMSDRNGMLFVFDNPGIHHFWMKGMEFPLDFLWIDSNCLVAEITENVSHIENSGTEDMRIYSPSSPIKYVLEINGGVSQTTDIQIGQRIRFLGNIDAKFEC